MRTKSRFVEFLLSVLLLSTLIFVGSCRSSQTRPPEDLTSAESPEPTPKAHPLSVSIEYFKERHSKSTEVRKGPVGIRVTDLEIPAELKTVDPEKEKKAISDILKGGYQIPLDFADLARKHKSKEFAELPLATEKFVLDVGGSSDRRGFTSFELKGNGGIGSSKITSDDLKVLQELAADFPPEFYDIENGNDRRGMKIRLVRMLRPKAIEVLKQIASEYHEKFDRPIRIISLSRSLEYQISLDKADPKAFKVSSDDMPPHLSGYAFDISYKFLDREEQQFLFQKLAKLETNGQVDAQRLGANKGFHVFVMPAESEKKQSN